jgi:hypothetical protein
MSVEPSPQDDSAPAAREPVAGDFIIPLLGCALVGYYLASTTDLVWEAKATGVFVGGVLLVLSVLHMARMVLQMRAGSATFSFGTLFDDTTFNRQRLGLLLLVATFIVTLHWVGTTLGLFVLLIAAMWLMGVRRITTLVGVAFVASATVYVLLIYLLSSRLPKGPVEQLLAALFGIGS